MTEATNTANTSRRGFLGTSGALAAVAATAIVPLAATAAIDPVVYYYRRMMALEAQAYKISDQSAIIRNALRARHGEGRILPSGAHAWDGDPDEPRLRASNEESERILWLSCQEADKMLAIPATTRAGILAKVKFAISQFPTWDDDDVDFHETTALAVLNEVAAVLGGDAAAEVV